MPDSLLGVGWGTWLWLIFIALPDHISRQTPLRPPCQTAWRLENGFYCKNECEKIVTDKNILSTLHNFYHKWWCWLEVVICFQISIKNVQPAIFGDHLFCQRLLFLWQCHSQRLCSLQQEQSSLVLDHSRSTFLTFPSSRRLHRRSMAAPRLASFKFQFFRNTVLSCAVNWGDLKLKVFCQEETNYVSKPWLKNAICCCLLCWL